MHLIPLPAFTDNYIWLIHDGRAAVVVDPGESAPVLAALADLQLPLAAILVTHHHGDHVGGIDALRPHLQGSVYGPASERIPAPFVPLRGGDAVEALGLRFAVIDVPGHTSGHIAFFCENASGEAAPGEAAGHESADGTAPARPAPLLFCGDTLFSGGCGRLFEGTAAQMHASLETLAALPADTRVCCAHEYTLANLKFARAVEPGNAELARYSDWCEAQRAAKHPTLPARIGRERLINPFLRCAEPAVVQAAQQHGAASPRTVDVFAALRHWKNDFR